MTETATETDLEQALRKETAKSEDLQAQLTALKYRTQSSVSRNKVRSVLLELVEALTGNAEEDLEGTELETVNSALEDLDLEKISRTFTVRVEGSLSSFSVEIEVEATSEDEAIERVNNDELEDEILDAIDFYDLKSSGINSIDNVEIG